MIIALHLEVMKNVRRQETAVSSSFFTAVESSSEDGSFIDDLDV